MPGRKSARLDGAGDDEAILLVDPAGRLSILSLPQGRVDIQNGRAWVYARTSDGAADAAAEGRWTSGGRHRAAIDASQAAANTSLAEPPSPRTARKRNDRNAEQGAAADAAQARRARAGPGAPTPPPVYRLPDPPPSRTRRRPWSSCPSPPRTCRAGADRHAGRGASRRCRARGGGRAQEAGHAVDAAVAEAASRKRRQPPRRGRRCHRLGQPPGDPDPDLRRRRPAAAEPTLAALRDYSVTPVAGQTAVGKRGRCCRWQRCRRMTTNSPTASSPPAARS